MSREPHPAPGFDAPASEVVFINNPRNDFKISLAQFSEFLVLNPGQIGQYSLGKIVEGVKFAQQLYLVVGWESVEAQKAMMASPEFKDKASIALFVIETGNKSANHDGSLLLVKRAMISGVGSGICLALAKSLRAQGVPLPILDIGLHQEVTKWLAAIQCDGGPKTVFHKTDVTDRDQLEGAFDVFAQQLGGDASLGYKLFDVNLLHPINLTRIAIRRFQQASSPGVVLHLSSIVAQKPSAVLPLYSTSKAVISQFVRCMAPLDSLCGVRVVAVAPGKVSEQDMLTGSSTRRCSRPSAGPRTIHMEKDFVLPVDEVVKAMMALLTDSKYPAGTMLEVGDLGGWREIQLLNDPSPQGKSTLPRAKAMEAIRLVEQALKEDKRSSTNGSKL
ncbi:uncharacterized protein A1O5_13090 [Cladophialophora psammophila CBS 110553]|uniref:Uncharacterized protein n=1 Tax=Cladophialophora psammophila CBS 110553 TaxID=1182543 RepID=W9W4Y6_9EURO|nr:uncharacterized protein A1O5_13090 [Cladophialophora psammophila CBS 110553]EXJ53639.1 hypothetical protein A1O5_13090 [Cladophialophora psammophila CBS 110553]